MPWVGPSLWGTPSSRAAKGPGSGVYSWLKLRLIQRDSIPDFTIPQRISLVLTPDASPEDEVKPSEDQTDEQSLSDMALGLLHIPTSCHYGVDTLRELPHTRRKESLFVAPVCSEYLLARKRLVPGRRHTSLRETRSCSATPAASPKPPSGGKRRQSVGMCPSVRSISPYNQCSNSPLGSAHRLSLSSQRSFSSGSDVCSCDSCPRARYFRRRSSSLEDIRQRLGSDESRRRSLTLGIVNHHAVSQHGTPSLGEVKFALSYDEAAKTLRFVLIRAEGVGSGRETRESYIYAKLTLLPGNCQKQKSRVVKCTHSPVYIQEFVFTDIDRASLDETTLTVRFLNKTHRFRADQFLGEIRLCLQDEDLQQELRAWRPLQPKQNEGVRIRFIEGLTYVYMYESRVERGERVRARVCIIKQVGLYRCINQTILLNDETRTQPGTSAIDFSLYYNNLLKYHASLIFLIISCRLDTIEIIRVLITVYKFLTERSNASWSQEALEAVDLTSVNAFNDEISSDKRVQKGTIWKIKVSYRSNLFTELIGPWQTWMQFLTHWGRVTQICVSKLAIIGSDNGLSPGRRQAII